MFNRSFYQKLASEFEKANPGFNAKQFVTDVTKGIEPLSLNQRMRNTTTVLKKHLPNKFDKAVNVMKKVIPNMNTGYTNLLFPDYVSVYGLDHMDLSLEALKYFTRFGSSEFAIREFLKKDFKKTIREMYKWAEDKNHHVRRLASEGSRPRLPWSFKLDEVIKKPSITRPILEILKADTELYVRKSVANHLNDIAKENPDYMLEVITSWDKTNPHTAWIIKHGSRTLIKKGHSGSLSVFDFEKNAKVDVKDFKVSKKVKLGDQLHFGFQLHSKKNKPQKLVVDYIIHYLKKSGELSPKVFKLKEVQLEPGARLSFEKKQLIKDFTTRKHFPGVHEIAVQVNGNVLVKEKFTISI